MTIRSTTAMCALTITLLGGVAPLAQGDDISCPRIDPIGQISLTGEAYDIVVDGDYAYLAMNADGLAIVDISDPGTPVLVGTYDTDGFARHVAVVGTTAYIGSITEGVDIIDVSDPFNPSFLGAYRGHRADCMDVDGATLCIGDVVADDLVVVDVSNPAAPAYQGRRTLTDAREIKVVGTIAYAVGGTRGWAFDISTPASPTLLTSFLHHSGVNKYGIDVVGTTGYVTGLSGSGGLFMVDLSGMPFTSPLGSVNIPAAVSVSVQGDFAYVGANSGIYVVDISDPNTPMIRHQYATSNTANGVAGVGEFSFATNGAAGLVVTEISEANCPADPDGDCDSDPDDISVFVTGFTDADPLNMDLDGDLDEDADDINAFVTAFINGCP